MHESVLVAKLASGVGIKPLTLRPPNREQPATARTNPCSKATPRIAYAEEDSERVANVRSNTHGMSTLKMSRLSGWPDTLDKAYICSYRFSSLTNDICKEICKNTYRLIVAVRADNKSLALLSKRVLGFLQK